MFNGFTDETVQFFLDLKFHNNADFFHSNHDRYVETVQTPFYEMIEALAPVMKQIDPMIEVRPHKCLSRIHRDTRFSKDKSPYRDHLWFLFKKAGEPREQSLLYYFEFGPDRLSWGLGTWGENRPLMDLFRNRMRMNPIGTLALIDDLDLPEHSMFLGGNYFKRIEIPDGIPQELRRWYAAREIYIGKYEPPYEWTFSPRILREVSGDFQRLAPLYRLLRGFADEAQQNVTGKE